MRPFIYLFTPFFLTLLFACRTYKPSELGKVHVGVELSFLHPDSIRKNKAEIDAKIINRLDSSIQFPSLFYWGIKNDPIADFILEMEKKGEGDRFHTFDIPDNYQPISEKIQLEKLKVNQVIADTSDIAFYYSYKIPQGTYRVRVLYRVSKYNNLSDIYSNWLTFSIE